MDNQFSPHKTPSKFLGSIRDAVSCKNMQSSPFYCLPNHATPPSKFSKIKNPFEAAINERLHLHVFSPSVFTEVNSSRTSEKFKWTIDDVSSLKPAHIDESTIAQFEPPNLEDDVYVQAKIEKYFNETHIAPSPWQQESNPVPLLVQTESPPLNIETETTEMCNVWTQTILSLPPKLPKEVEKALLPYFTFTEDQRRQSVDLNSSLCRRLFHFGSASDAEESNVSSIQSDLSEIGSPIIADNADKRKRTFDESPDPDLIPAEISPISKSTPNFRKLSNCEISPISLTLNISDMQFRSVIPNNENDIVSPICMLKKIKNQSFAKLDFSGHMSVDNSFNMAPENDAINIQNCTDSSESPLRGNEFMDSSCNWDVEYNQISISNRSQTRRSLFEATKSSVECMDISNLTTPKSKIIGSQRKKLSDSFKYTSENSLSDAEDLAQIDLIPGEKSRFLQNCDEPEELEETSVSNKYCISNEDSCVDNDESWVGNEEDSCAGKGHRTQDTGYITGDMSEKLIQSRQFEGMLVSDTPITDPIRIGIFASTPSKRYFYDVGK